MKNKLHLSFFILAAACLSSLASNAQVNVNPNNSNGCSPLNVSYTCTAGGATYYVWDFNDGPQTGFLLSPTIVHTYSARQNPYFGWVQAYDASYAYLGQANFSANVNGAEDSLTTNNYFPCPGDIILLTLGGTVNPQNIDWDFGDGATSYNTLNSNFEHKYINPGTYYPKAIVTTTCGIDTLTQVINVSVSGAFASNIWTYIPVDSVCPGDPFIIQPFFGYPNYVIDWGDGNFSTSQIAHAYASTGTYNIAITYVNGCGNTFTQTSTVFVGNSLPVPITPQIINNPDSTCINNLVSFYCDPPVFTTYSWNFGGTDTSLTQTASRQFTSLGYHSLTLSVTNGCGSSLTVSDSVNIVSSIALPGASVTIIPPTICAGDAIYTNVNPSMGNDDDFTYSWDYGDGNSFSGIESVHTYSTNGTYTVNVTMTNSCGNSTSFSGNVTVTNNVIPDSNIYQYGPVPFQFGSVTSCVGDSVIFVFLPASNLDTITWDFGDLTSGIVSSTITVKGVQYRIIKHAYSANGIYTARVTFKNACGNSFTAYSPVDVNVGSNSSIQESKIFYDDVAYHCQGKDVAFFAFGGSSYLWNFGDGTGDLISYGTMIPVNHAFQNPGQFMITCKATNGCGYSVYDTTYITIPPSAIHITTNTVSSNCSVNDGKAIAIASGGETPYLYQWSNGNSTFLADSLTSGIYVVTVTDQHGCSNFSIATVSDQQAPVIAVSTVIPVSCYGGNNGAIDINLIGNTPPYTYIWSNGSTTQDVYQLVSGPYEVSVTDANGCVATKSIFVGEPPAVVLSTQSSPASCGGNDGGAGVAVSGTTGPYAFIWSNGGNTQIIYGLSSGIYTVTVVDNNGCIYDADVAVNEVNGAIIILDSITGTGCGTNLASIYVHPVLGTAPFTYSWSTGATSQNLIGVTVGNYTVTVTGNNGCESIKEFSITKDPPQGTSICMVTVDTITGMNRIVFVKDTNLINISGYNIYKESTMSGLYYLVGNVPFSSQSAAWTDSLSDSKVRSWRYKVTVVDNCGGESEMSGEHKTIHLNTNAGINNSYNLIWDQYEGFNFNMYNIYRYDQANGWVFLTSVPNNLISYSDLTPPPNTIAYMVDAVPSFSCSDSSARYSSSSPLAAINSSHSNIKNLIGGPQSTGSDLLFAPEFGIYPNPSSGMITIDVPSSQSGYNVRINNSIGQVVYNIQLRGTDMQQVRNIRTLDLSTLAKGLYTISFESENGRIHKKLVLQ